MLNKQRGSTLLVALVMLVLLTLMAISAMNATTSSIQIVGNAQFREEASAAGQKAIETVISSGTFKSTPPAAQQIDINGDGVADYNVTFTPSPSCVAYIAVSPGDPNVPAICYGSAAALCFWATWNISAAVTDLHGSGATAALHQGVRTITGLNDALTYCGV